MLAVVEFHVVGLCKSVVSQPSSYTAVGVGWTKPNSEMVWLDML